jgi:hypothetical protein
MRLRRMQHSGTHCVAFFGTRGRQGIRHPRSIYDRRLAISKQNHLGYISMTLRKIKHKIRKSTTCSTVDAS